MGIIFQFNRQRPVNGRQWTRQEKTKVDVPPKGRGQQGFSRPVP